MYNKNDLVNVLKQHPYRRYQTLLMITPVKVAFIPHFVGGYSFPQILILSRNPHTFYRYTIDTSISQTNIRASLVLRPATAGWLVLFNYITTWNLSILDFHHETYNWHLITYYQWHYTTFQCIGNFFMNTELNFK